MKSWYNIYCLLLSSCVINNGNPEYSLVPNKIVKFDISETANYVSPFITYYQDNENEYLVNYNQNEISIEFYDFSTNKLSLSVVLKGNPLFANKIRAFYVHNFDSIFVCLAYSNQIVLVNKNSETINSWEIKDENATDEKYFLGASAVNNIIYKNNKIYVMKLPFLKDPLKMVLFQPELIFDVKESKISSKIGTWPAVYKQDKWWHIIGYSLNKVINNDNQQILSFPIDDNLYIFDRDSLIRTVMIESQYLKDYDFPSFDNDYRRDVEYKVKYVATLGRYYNLIYDFRRNIYYRIVLHPCKYNNKDGSTNTSVDMPWSIIVIDSNFKILCEKYFPPKKYIYNNIIINKDGILVSNNHDLNSKLDPEKFSFTLLKLKKD